MLPMMPLIQFPTVVCDQRNNPYYLVPVNQNQFPFGGQQPFIPGFTPFPMMKGPTAFMPYPVQVAPKSEEKSSPTQAKLPKNKKKNTKRKNLSKQTQNEKIDSGLDNLLEKREASDENIIVDPALLIDHDGLKVIIKRKHLHHDEVIAIRDSFLKTENPLKTYQNNRTLGYYRFKCSHPKCPLEILIKKYILHSAQEVTHQHE